jgi:uncharacterized protein YjiS (DUF1127 family)
METVVRLYAFNFAVHPVPAAPRTALIGAVIDAIGATLARWRDRRRQRTYLAMLDERLRADIGLTRAQCARDAALPFWR